MKKKLLLSLFIVISFLSFNTYAQMKDYGLKMGLQFNGIMPYTEFEVENGLSMSSYLARGFLRFELVDAINAEFGAGYGNITGDAFNFVTNSKGGGSYSTKIIPLDLRLLIMPFEMKNWNPYLYGGFGMLNYTVGIKPAIASPVATSSEGWTGIIPFGIGTEIKMSEDILVDLAVGATYALKDNLNSYDDNSNKDMLFNISAGIVFTGESSSSDKDKDGLTKAEELELGTDPNNPDTDGDGLKDGDEINVYKTDPLNPDSDSDGLKDGEEVFTFQTNPNLADTDSDGLRDGDEVNTHRTDPKNADSDGDRLNDGDEVLKYKTDPLKTDTDFDGLSDFEEVMTYKTNPLKADTDGGSVPDGKEISNKTNPLDPTDDIPKKQEPKEVSKEWTFSTDKLFFALDKYKLSDEGKNTLNEVYDEVSKYESGVSIEISGHADATGSDAYNMKLSEKRANAVKDYFISRGLDSNVFTVKWFGERNPIAPNDTPENRASNRRVEVKAKGMQTVDVK